MNEISFPQTIYFDSRTEKIRLKPIQDDENDEYCHEMYLCISFERGRAFVDYIGTDEGGEEGQSLFLDKCEKALFDFIVASRYT
jgi:hypothetical protein